MREPDALLTFPGLSVSQLIVMTGKVGGPIPFGSATPGAAACM